MAVTPGYLVATFAGVTSGNSYTYNRINGLAGYTVQSGDVLEYGINWQSGPVSNLQIGMDASTGTGAFDGSFLRSSSNTDQHGLSPHPATDLSGYASQTWYDRQIPLTYLVGQTINQWWLTCEADTNGTYVAWIRELRVTNGGVTKFTIYSNTDPNISIPTPPTTSPTGPQNLDSLTSLTAVAAVNVVATGGGGGGGSGVGNMLGSLFFGESMLGADPGPGTGGGNGYGNTSNMLGIFMFGEPMLGADPSNGAGGTVAVAVTGNVYQLTPATCIGRTTVTGSLRENVGLRGTNIAAGTTVRANITQSSLRGSTIAGGTTVTGSLSSTQQLSASVSTRTTVTANLRKTIPAITATSNITCSTTVTGSLTRSILRGSIYSPMYVAGTLNLRELLSGQTSRGASSLTARLGIARSFANVTIPCGTAVTANLTYSSVFSGGSIVCGTTVTGSITRSFLRGSIACGTTVTGATPTVRSAYSGLFTCGTRVTVKEGGFKRTLRALVSTDVQTIQGRTTVTGRTYVTPQDFVPIYLNTSTRVQGQAQLQLRFGSANLSNFIHARTTVTGAVTGLQTMTGVIHGKTTVTGKAKAGFGGEVLGFGYVSAVLGIRYLLTHARVNTIACRTTVVAARPENGTAGHAWGGTRFAYTYGTPDSDIPDPFTGKPGYYVTDQYNYHYVGGNTYVPYYYAHLPLLGVILALKVDKAMGGTRLNSLIIPSRAYAHNHKGPAPFYGPYGSVSLYISPKGDVGTGDFIDCQTVISGSMLTLRHRLIQILGATGLEFPGQIVFTGDAVRGIGTRTVTSGTVLQKEMAQRKPVPQNVFYV